MQRFCRDFIVDSHRTRGGRTGHTREPQKDLQRIHQSSVEDPKYDMTTLRVIWRFRGRKRSSQTPHRGLDSQRIHRGVAENAQRTHRQLTEDLQRTPRGFREDSKNMRSSIYEGARILWGAGFTRIRD